MPNILEEATATFQEIIRLHELNKELLETLSLTMTWLRDYAEKQNIFLPNQSAFNSLITKAEMLINEISEEQPSWLNSQSIRRIFTDKKSDKDLTEPLNSSHPLSIKTCFGRCWPRRRKAFITWVFQLDILKCIFHL